MNTLVLVPSGEIVELSLLSRELLVADFYSPCQLVQVESTAATRLQYLTAWDHKRLVLAHLVGL